MKNNNSTKSNKETKNALNSFKNEVASEIGVDLKAKDLKAKDAGRVGGQMVKKMVESAENQLR